jgi:hypothetical protein
LVWLVRGPFPADKKTFAHPFDYRKIYFKLFSSPHFGADSDFGGGFHRVCVCVKRGLNPALVFQMLFRILRIVCFAIGHVDHSPWVLIIHAIGAPPNLLR